MHFSPYFSLIKEVLHFSLNIDKLEFISDLDVQSWSPWHECLQSPEQPVTHAESFMNYIYCIHSSEISEELAIVSYQLNWKADSNFSGVSSLWSLWRLTLSSRLSEKFSAMPLISCLFSRERNIDLAALSELSFYTVLHKLSSRILRWWIQCHHNLGSL